MQEFVQYVNSDYCLIVRNNNLLQDNYYAKLSVILEILHCTKSPCYRVGWMQILAKCLPLLLQRH